MKYSNRPKDQARDQIAEDVAAFLAIGGEIQHFPPHITSDQRIVYLNRSKAGETIKFMARDVNRSGGRRPKRLELRR